MGRILFRIGIVILISLCHGLILGQDAPSTRVVDGVNGEFIVHTVEAKQTLYAISKMYSVSVEDIQAANPNLKDDGLKIGQTLRIPSKQVNKKEAKKASITLSPDTIYHEVLKKETVYALTKKYEITEEELVLYNPELKEGLKIGMVVKIPVPNFQDNEVTDTKFELPEEDSLKLHEVLPKETLYSLSKEYSVSTDSIQMVNNGLPEGLKVGSTIRIPIPNTNFSDTSFVGHNSVDSNGIRLVSKLDTLKIGVFLPFCIEKNLEMQEVNENQEEYILTKISLEFMRGIEMAVDSLNTLGYHVVTEYFDTKNDTAECRRIVNEEMLHGFHFFVGPLYQVNFKILALKAKELKTPIVSPVKISSRLLLDNKYVIKSHASSPSQVIYEAQFVGKNYTDSNLVLFSGGNAQDKRYSSIYQKYINNAINDSIPIHRIWQPSKDNFKRHVKLGETNYVGLISTDEAFVSSALSVFYGLSDEKTKFTVFGLDSWKGFGSIDYDYLKDLNVTYPVQQYIDFYSKGTEQFIEKYRIGYLTDPSLHVFSAFDIAWFFGNTMYNSKGDWEAHISENKNSGLSLRFEFVKIGTESGFENRGGFLLRNSDKGLHLIH